MFNRIRQISLAMSVALGVSAAYGTAVASDITVTGIRLGENAATTRLVLDIDAEVSFKTLLLDAPYRIVLDLPEVNWKMKAGGNEGTGAIDHYRYGLFRDGVSRLVLDLNQAAVIEKAFVLPPQGAFQYRLVIDIRTTDRASFTTAMNVSKNRRAASTNSRPSTSPRPSVAPATSARSPNRRLRVAIDAGHGGVDPGNLGVIGVPEKTIVLNMARSVKKAIENKTPYEVIMVRDRDIYVPHRERFQIARHAGADLFISIHADSLEKSRKNAKVRGATVYTLSEKASDAEAAALARRENRSDLIAGVDLVGESDEVTSILLDLVNREKMNYSAQFAGMVIDELKGRVYLRKNPHRFASLLVLKAPDVPSVLVEVGYLSNRKDAKYLNSADGKTQVSGAIASAVTRYFKTTTAQAY